MKSRSLAFYFITVAVIVTQTLVTGGQSAHAQSGPQPGATDPMGKSSRYYVLRDDELFAPGAGSTDDFDTSPDLYDYTYFPDANLSLPRSVVQGINDQPDYTHDPQIWAASGRVITATYDQVVYARRIGSSVSLWFLDQSSNDAFLSADLLPALAPRAQGFTDFINLSVGDLDKVADSNGVNHDEVVVVFASPGPNNDYQVNVAVLDYTDPSTESTRKPVAVVTAQTSNPIETFEGNQDDPLGVVVGDFDGDRQNEIAVAHVQNQKTVWMTTFRYTNDGRGNRSLQQANATAVPPGATNDPNEQFAGGVSVAAGDFNGDNIDEFLIGFPVFVNPSATSPDLVRHVDLCLSQSDKTLLLKQVSCIPIGYYGARGEVPPVFVQVVSGLFKYDPPDFDFGRRQFAVAWNTPEQDQKIFVQAFSVDAAWNMTPLWDAAELGAAIRNTCCYGNVALTDRFSIAAGGYRGVKSSKDPRWGIAINTTSYDNVITDDGASAWTFVGMLDVASGQVATIESAAFQEYFPQMRMPLAAYDNDGDSLYLGAPVHFIVENAVRTDYILQEPPKHAFYDSVPNVWNNNTPSNQIITISRYDDFNITLTDKEGTTFSSNSKDTMDWSVGGSESASSVTTFKEGDDLGLVKEETTLTLSFSEQASYDYQQHKDSYNSQYVSRTITFQGKTDHDDYVGGQIQTFDIWRYRIYGLEGQDQQGNPNNGFYDVVLPVTKTLPFTGGGSSYDWYQPIQENGNILSYPAVLGGDPNNPFLPDDLGVYTDTNGTQVMQPLVPASQQAFDATSGGFDLLFSDTTGSGGSRSYSHNFKESADMETTVKTDADFFGSGGSEAISVGFSVNSSQSFGNVKTSNETTNTSTGITLNKKAGDETLAYTFYPVFYFTQDGTIKAAHAVNPLGDATGQAFWAGVYGAKPDPALNLPARFAPVYAQQSNLVDGWKPAQSSARKQMRGFFLRKASPNPVTGQYDPLAYAPAAGDQVRVDARVYNYSTGKGVQDLLVQFQAILYDSTNDVETKFTACPNGQAVTALGRCPIGQTTIGEMNPLQMITATVTWDTTGFGPVQVGGSQQYRIYPVLDPNNTIDEIYETEDPNRSYPYVDSFTGKTTQLQGIDPGQNNEGWGLATVMASSSSAANEVQANLASPGAGADMYLKSDSVAAIDVRDGTLHTGRARALLFEPIRLRVSVYSDKVHPEFNHLMVYDGNPRKGGTLIANKIVHSGNPDSAHVWVNWIPRAAGRHKIFAQLVGDRDDPNTDNHMATMIVRVREPHRLEERDDPAQENDLTLDTAASVTK